MVVAQLSWRGWVVGRARHPARRRRCCVPLLPAPPRAGAARRRPARAAARPGGRVPPRAGPRCRVEPGPPARAAAHAAARRPGHRGLQPRALHPRAQRRRRSIVKRPASGLVTAVEPVMRACSGTWIAHGSGSADREVVDAHDRVRRAARPRRLPAAPHLAHARRRSRATTTASPTKACGRCATSRTCGRCSASRDWQAYRAVNQRFADAVVAEARSEDPVVLVQDYHFALLPAMIRAAAAARDHPDLLAHPLAEPRVVRHLPVAARDPAGHARQHHPRLPHALPLQELHRDGRPLPRGAHRARALDDLVPAATRR